MIDRDSKLIFENYRKALINELDVGTDWAGGPSPAIRKGIKTAPGGGYLIGNIAKSLGISVEDAADKLTAKIFPRLFKQKPGVIDGKEVGYINPATNEDQFRMQIKNALELALKDLQAENPNLKIPGSDALKGYTARVIANLGEFYRDYARGEKGVVAPVRSVVKVKKAVVGAEPSGASPTSEPTETIYVRSNVRFIPDFQKVFAELPDEITVPAKQDLYTSKELDTVVRDAIMQAYDVKTSRDNEFVTNFIDSMKFKNAFIESDATKQKEGEGSGEVKTVDSDELDDPVDILRDLGTWDRARGFDAFDQHSSI